MMKICQIRTLESLENVSFRVSFFDQVNIVMITYNVRDEL